MVLSSETKRATMPMYKDDISSPGKICLAPTLMNPFIEPMIMHGRSSHIVLLENNSSDFL
jgi:hypothetical protein